MGEKGATNSLAEYIYIYTYIHLNRPPKQARHVPSALPALDASLQLGKLLRGGTNGGDDFRQALAGLDKGRNIIHLLPLRHGHGGWGKETSAAALEQAAAAGGPT